MPVPPLPKRNSLQRTMRAREMSAESVRRRGCMEMILSATSLVEGVGAEYLASPARGRAPLAGARQKAQYLCHVGFGLSYTEIGARFNRDRTTVAHACRCIEDSRDAPVCDYALSRLEHALAAMAASLGLVEEAKDKEGSSS